MRLNEEAQKEACILELQVREIEESIELQRKMEEILAYFPDATIHDSGSTDNGYNTDSEQVHT